MGSEAAAKDPQGLACDVCHRVFRSEPRWRTRLRGGPKRRCTDRRGCWDAYMARTHDDRSEYLRALARLAWSSDRGLRLYRDEVERLLAGPTEKAARERRTISEAELFDVHVRATKRVLNTLRIRY